MTGGFSTLGTTGGFGGSGKGALSSIGITSVTRAMRTVKAGSGYLLPVLSPVKEMKSVLLTASNSNASPSSTFVEFAAERRSNPLLRTASTLDNR